MQILKENGGSFPEQLMKEKLTVIVPLVSMLFLFYGYGARLSWSGHKKTWNFIAFWSDEIVLNTTMVLYSLDPYAEGILVLGLYIYLRVFTIQYKLSEDHL